MRLKNAIEKTHHVKLSGLSFIWGNIKPDLTARHKKVPHFKKDADLYFKSEVKRLLHEEINEGEKCSPSFSKQLGVITHYLSDFFCHAHSADFKGGTLKHSLYELWLSLYFIKNSSQYVRGQSYCIHNGAGAICKQIDKMQHRWLKTKFVLQPKADLTYLYQACLMLCSSVIFSCTVCTKPIAIPQLSLL